MNNEVRTTAIRVADQITRAINLLDAEAFGACYADDATVWHNTDGLTQTKTENIAWLKSAMKMFSSMQYVTIRRSFTDDGFIQQHVLNCGLADGRSLEIPACLVVTLVGQYISHIDEYLDPTPFAALMGG